MKIKSNFKDYYDYVAHQYGEPSIVYNRVNTAPDYVCGGTMFEASKTIGDIQDSVLHSDTGISWYRDKHTKFRTLFIAGNLYYMFDDVLNDVVKASDRLVVISKGLKAPVFRLDKRSYRNVCIRGRVPVLGQEGDLAKRVPANEMYQRIADYCANVLRDNPDTKPPVQISDKDRTVQYGFDLKQSFRHRK